MIHACCAAAAGRYHGPMKVCALRIARTDVDPAAARAKASGTQAPRRARRAFASLIRRAVTIPLGLSLGLFLAASSLALPADNDLLLRTLNEGRRQGCNGTGGSLPALRENARLSAAAGRVADGNALDVAMRAADYRAIRAVAIALKGYKTPAALAQGALGNFCSTVNDRELLEAGIHLRGTEGWILLAAPFAPPAATDAQAVQAHVLELVNLARAKARRCGKQLFPAAPPLRLNAALTGVASMHAADMARHSYFSHTGRDGSRVADRVSRVGYKWRAVGENIAAGQTRAETAVDGWVKSPGHCVNLMSRDFTDMGIAYAVNDKSSNGIYWVQVFGTPR